MERDGLVLADAGRRLARARGGGGLEISTGQTCEQSTALLPLFITTIAMAMVVTVLFFCMLFRWYNRPGTRRLALYMTSNT